MKKELITGIEKIAAYIPKYYITMEQLAHNRNIPLEKLTKGLLQETMSIPDPNQDIISMGVNAANKIINTQDKKDINLVIFCTESGFDFSKAGAVTISALLNINPNTRCIEMKQACQSTASAIAYAYAHLQLYQDNKVLIICSDIAKYEPNTPAESSQGAGAIAMLISNNPKILKFNNDSKIWYDDIYDFYRPTKQNYPIVDGPNSKTAYINSLTKVFNQNTHCEAILFHTPYPKLVYNALASINTNNYQQNLEYLDQALIYNKKIGNIYTGSLYLSLISLLDNSQLSPESNIGMFSYGSGCVAEYFTWQLLNDYKANLLTDYHQSMINNRINIDFKTYENYMYNTNENNITLSATTDYCCLKSIKNYQREYYINE